MSRFSTYRWNAISVMLFGVFSTTSASVADEASLQGPWKQNAFAQPIFEIQGTGERNNPIRRALAQPFRGDELFLRYRLRYAADTIDQPTDGNGEFLVCWLDVAEGNDASTHSAHVPNVGIHVSNEKNHFMVRYHSGGERFAAPLEGDRDYLIVARVWKSNSGADQSFDRLDLWIDPQPTAEYEPHATTSEAKAISEIGWIGFSTGRKTELGDRIQVWDIDVATSWRSILKLPAPIESTMPEPVPVVEKTVSFKEHVFPILKSKCFACHAGEDNDSGVRLDIVDEVLNQTAPRDADKSRLIELVMHGEMPPEEGKLAEADITTLKTWINEGLDWDESLLPTPTPETAHWAFQPIQKPQIPTDLKNPDWVRTPVDAFIARKQDELGITPAAEASQATLQRRLTLDLTGMPIADQSDRDLESLTEELLHSPAYGERWGRHWLDVARWAESNGHQHNRHRPHAWKYRDWVIDAFNDDMPYDEFITKQIAGDEITPYEPENIIATGFLAAARYSGNELDKDIQRNDILVDIVNTTSQAFMGLTMECAQCHTHKFDPLSIRDYYRMQAFFAKGQPGHVVLSENETIEALVAERWQIFDKVHDRLVEVRRKSGYPEPIYITPQSVIAKISGADKKRFVELEQQIAKLPQSWSYYSPVTSPNDLPVAPHEMRWPLPRLKVALKYITPTILIRGDVKSRGPEVTPGWPAVFGPTPELTEQPRLALAKWLTDPQHPLTARVWANRIWQWHFGQGLVETSEDFGTQGTPPSHPELLDYLASELIESGWSTKHIHRLIVNSATYRQASRNKVDYSNFDADNKTYWRWTPRRLEAEAIRDSILQVTGQLNPQRGGVSQPATSNRKSLYLTQRRDNFPHQQMLFDSANGLTSCSRRRTSTTALQPLWLMNSDFMQQSAQALAKTSDSIPAAFERCLGRPPAPDEVAALEELKQSHGMPSVCLAILNSSEFLYVP